MKQNDIDYKIKAYQAVVDLYAQRLKLNINAYQLEIDAYKNKIDAFAKKINAALPCKK